MGFSFDIQYKPGTSNNVADALSRKSVATLELGSLVTKSVVDWDSLDREVATDQLLKQIRMDLTTNSKSHASFELYNKHTIV